MSNIKEALATIDIADILQQMGIEYEAYLDWVGQEPAIPSSFTSLIAEPSQKQ